MMEGTTVSVNENMYIELRTQSSQEEELARELVILYLLTGSALVRINRQEVELQKGQAYLIPVDTAYLLKFTAGTVLARFSLNYAFLCAKAERDFINVSNSAFIEDKHFGTELDRLLRKALLEFAANGNRCTLKNETLTYEIALLLVERFAAADSRVSVG